MSEPTRDDLTIQERDQNDNLIGGWRYLTDAEFEAIVDADPRWVRAEEKAGYIRSIEESNRHLGSQLVEYERHFRRVTVDCDTCNGTGWGDWADDGVGHVMRASCPDCTDGKVPADGVFNVSQFTVDILAEVEVRADAPQYWLVPVKGADDGV